MIRTWEDSYTEEVVALWNTVATRDDYQELDTARFEAIFMNNSYFDPETAWVWIEEGRVMAFACGCTGEDLPLGDVAGYITCIVTVDDKRAEERSIRLLEVMEARFLALGKRQAEALFFNPMQLPWYVPGTARHEHNNAPGVPSGSALHAVLLRHGYLERATQCAMYLALDGFAVPETILDKESRAAAEGYQVGLFNKERHDQPDILLTALGNPLWQREVTSAVESDTPVVVASQEGEPVGFAGPVVREPSGRGRFAGIGVHPGHEGHGLGSILFFRLCAAFQAIGTNYMTLYTGSNNPALRIYERAGFRTVKTFATMRKELVQ
ncbi:GNAT family N-acetyltransferase [Paenibacillus daejeonensis]|uniref:GNAT family N-acetyltransferase n=1 Tax=Paenibacillus daejeonensis TaxID=135193 RepID=UPI0003703297|nr:GNAT family N-acetyltransferase [Paenibacillus daejeonensis]